MSFEQEFSKDLVCFFDSVSVQRPAFYSPLFPSIGQCSMKCSSVSLSSLHPTHISLLLCQEFSPRFKLFVLALNHNIDSRLPLWSSSFLSFLNLLCIPKEFFFSSSSLHSSSTTFAIFSLIYFAVLSFISLFSICGQFIYFLVASQHFLFLFFLLSSIILFSTSLFPVSILLRYRSQLLAILDFMLLIPISPPIAACAAYFGALKILLFCSVLCFL